MDSRNSEMPCKIRKRRFPTASSSSFANNNLLNQELLIEKTPSYSLRNENVLDRGACKEDESTIAQKAGTDLGVNELVNKSSTNVDRSRNLSRTAPCLVSAPEIINRHCRRSSFTATAESFAGMHMIYAAKQFEGKIRPCDKVKTETETMTKNHQHLAAKLFPNLDEINHSLTISKELLKVLAHIWTTDPDHNHHPTTTTLVSALNHELKKARSHVNKLIQERDNSRVVVKTATRELEVERKLRQQTERINKKLGRELANTKSFLSKALEKAESEKRANEILEQLCEEMTHGIEEDKVELEELKKESIRVREEIEEEREMLRVTDMLREERLHMKLLDAKYEYEDKHVKLNTLIRDLEDLLEADNDGVMVIDHMKRMLKENDEGVVVIDENALGNETTNLFWYQNEGEDKGEAVNDENTLVEESVSTRHEGNGLLERYSSDCIELELEFDKKNVDEDDSNGCFGKKVLAFPCLDQIKEYEDEMERYKMIKDLRDHIVSGSGLTMSQGFVMLQEAITQGQ